MEKYGNESDVKRDHLSCDVSYPKTGIMYLYPSKETHPETPIWFTYYEIWKVVINHVVYKIILVIYHYCNVKRKVYAFQLALNLRDKFSPFKNIELLNNLHNAFEVFGRLIMVEPYNLRRLIIGNIKKQAESNYNHYIFYTCKYSNVSIFVFW